MLGDISVVSELYVVCGYTDMRKSIDGLCTLVKDQLHMEPENSSALYLFCGRRCDRIKALLHEPMALFCSTRDWINMSADTSGLVIKTR